ncbi:MAG TPA: endonuclease/exonuclease/phosphatase family protein [Lacipirellulaceae bacterium]
MAPSPLPAESRRDGVPSRWLSSSRFYRVTMWTITFGLLAIAAMRFAAHDVWDVFIWFNAFTPYLYLPAYIILATALWQRRWRLAAANLILVACHLYWVTPDFRSATTYPTSAASAKASRTVRIFSANINATNPDHESMLNEIAGVDPDIVVLIEYRRWWTHSLRESPVLKPYKYGTNLDRPYDGEVAIFSRIPISNQQMIWIGTRVTDVVDISLGSSSLRLLALHSPRPFVEKPFDYHGFWSQAISLISQQTRPIVVIGDFNATQYSRAYQDLMSLNLRSAHTDRGRGYATTWPNGEDPAPPIRIDQAFLSPDVECLNISEGIGHGSDHRPLIVDIRVHAENPVSGISSAGR